MKYILNPCITESGEIAEFMVEEGKKWHEVISRTSVPFEMSSAGDLVAPAVKRELFNRQTFAFKIDDKRRVDCDVFIHENFMSYLIYARRDREIEKFVQINAAWFFSYGDRRSSLI